MWALTPERTAFWFDVARRYTEVRLVSLLERMERSQADADYWTKPRENPSIVTAATALFHAGVTRAQLEAHIAIPLAERPEQSWVGEIEQIIDLHLGQDNLACGVGNQDHPELALWPRYEGFCIAPMLLFDFLRETENERFHIGGYEHHSLGTIASEVGDDLTVLAVAWQLYQDAEQGSTFEEPELAIAAAVAIIYPS